MKLSLQIQGLEKVQATLRKLQGQQVKEAVVKAINDTAFDARKQVQREFTEVFDRPTSYIVKSVQVQQATVDKPEATVAPTYMGGKGVDPQKILAAEVGGGSRKLKRSERALQAAGILPAGYFTSIPRNPFPGSDDGRGNLRGPFIVQLLSYFQAFGEQGYKANMSAKRRKKLENVGTNANGAKSINGVVYFVTMGGLRTGTGQHLPAGIWAKQGTHGANVRPVLMFIKQPTYRSRITGKAVADKAGLQAVFERRLRFRIRQAAGV